MNGFAKKIAEDARALGVRKGSVLLVHSSFRSLRTPGVCAEDVIGGLLAALGDEGTLVLPALSYKYCGKGKSLTFDVRNTPSNVGYLPEFFRTSYPGVRRSLCPTHSCCAVGADRDFLLDGHSLDDTPAGPNSPFRRVMELDGSILFIGCTTRYNTSMHAVEELSRPDYLFGERLTYRMLREDGSETEQSCFAHDFRNVAQEYDRIEPLLPGDALRKGNILGAHCDLLRCVPMWETADAYYRKDPHYFISELPAEA